MIADSILFYNPADFVWSGLSLREWDKAIWKNNPMCISGWRELILKNNPRGHTPNHNPTEIEEMINRLAKECSGQAREEEGKE